MSNKNLPTNLPTMALPQTITFVHIWHFPAATTSGLVGVGSNNKERVALTFITVFPGRRSHKGNHIVTEFGTIDLPTAQPDACSSTPCCWQVSLLEADLQSTHVAQRDTEHLSCSVV